MTNLMKHVGLNGIEYSESKHVPNLLIHPEVDNLLVNSEIRKRVAAPRQSNGVEILPEISSLDPRFLRFLFDMNEALKKEEWQPKVDDQTGLSVNFIGGGSSRILSVAGVKKLPVGTPIDTNLEIRERIAEDLRQVGLEKIGRPIKLHDEPINKEEENLFDWTCEALMRTRLYGSTHLRRAASTMIPDFKGGPRVADGDIDFKKGEIDRLFKFLETRSDKWIEPKEWYAARFYLLYLCVERLQADVATKERWSNTGVDYVKVGRTLADMPKFKMLPLAEHLVGMRVRTAYGASGSISYALSVAMTPVRNGMFYNYEFTYKHRTPAEVSKKINKFRAVLGVDVTQYDQSIAAHWLERYCVNLEKFAGFSKAMASLNYYHVSSGALAPCPFAQNDTPWLAPGTLFDLKGYSFTRGLASGTPLNPDIGKTIMTFEILSRAKRSGLVTIESVDDVDRILRGHDQNLAFLNSSDDTLLLGKDRASLKKVLYTDGYLRWDEEDVPSFLGTVYGGSPGNVVGYPNIMSYFNRRVNPESGIGRKPTDPRYYWRTGMLAQDRHYGVHPMFPKARKLLDQTWKKHFGHEFSSNYENGSKDPVNFDVANLTDIDRLVLIKPEVVHYMIKPEDVSPEVLELSMASVPTDDVIHYCTRFHQPDLAKKGKRLDEMHSLAKLSIFN